MNTHPELIVMLTYNDVTVPQAAEVFAKCEHTRARYWALKRRACLLPRCGTCLPA